MSKKAKRRLAAERRLTLAIEAAIARSVPPSFADKNDPPPRPIDLPPEPLPSQRRGISDMSIGMAMAKEPTLPLGVVIANQNPFAVAQPMPGVIPQNAPSMAADRDIADLYGTITTTMVSEGLAFLGYPYLAQLAQRSEYRRLSEIIAKHMTRKWIRITAKGDEDKTDKITALVEAMEQFRIADLFREASEQDGFFGRSQIFIDTGNDDPDELETMLLISRAKIKKGGIKGFRVIEPYWTYPADYNSSNPLAKDFYKPTSWYVMGKKIHSTRLITFVSRDLPDILKPAYSFGGLSLTQMAKPYVDNWLRTRQSISDLIASFSTMVLKTDLSSTLSGELTDELVKRAKLFNLTRNNRGLYVLDKETEDFTNVSAPLGTLDHLQAQSQEHMASVSGIPLVFLLGLTPSGLNASSEGEIRVFYDWIKSQQVHLYSPKIRLILDILQLNLFGEIDQSITFEFEPLWETSEQERSTIRKTNADTADAYINAGVLDPAEERDRLAHEDGGLYNNIDLSHTPEPPGVAGEDDPDGEETTVEPGGGEPDAGQSDFLGGDPAKPKDAASPDNSAKDDAIA